MGEVRQVPSSGERALRVAASAFALTVCALAPAAAANAIGLPTSYNMSPSSGPVGTTVNVSGTGCTGLLSKSVVVTAATVPQTVIQPSVASNGSWQGSFSIPSATPAAAVVVGAVCVSDGLSLAYSPRTFTVTGAIVTPPTVPVTLPVTLPTVPTLPTLPQTTLPTLPGVTPTTPSSNPGNPTDPSTPVSVPSDRIDNGTPGGGGGNGTSSNIGDGISSGTGGDANGSATGSGAAGKGGKTATGARAAELNSPELSVAKGKGSNGIAWLLWLLALSFPTGGLALYVWMRHVRRPHAPAPETDVS